MNFWAFWGQSSTTKESTEKSECWCTTTLMFIFTVKNKNVFTSAWVESLSLWCVAQITGQPIRIKHSPRSWYKLKWALVQSLDSWGVCLFPRWILRACFIKLIKRQSPSKSIKPLFLNLRTGHWGFPKYRRSFLGTNTDVLGVGEANFIWDLIWYPFIFKS